MDTSHQKIERVHALLVEALTLLDEREFLVEAAFVQTALDRVRETIQSSRPSSGLAGDTTDSPSRKH